MSTNHAWVGSLHCELWATHLGCWRMSGTLQCHPWIRDCIGHDRAVCCAQPSAFYQPQTGFVNEISKRLSIFICGRLQTTGRCWSPYPSHSATCFKESWRLCAASWCLVCVGENWTEACPVASAFASSIPGQCTKSWKGLSVVLSSKHLCISPLWSLVLTTGPSISPKALPVLKSLERWTHGPLADYMLLFVCPGIHLLLSCWPSWRTLSWLCLPKGPPFICILREDLAEATSLFLQLFTKRGGRNGHREPQGSIQVLFLHHC